MLTPEAMLGLAVELTDAAADGDAESLAALAWRLYGEAGEDLLAEIGGCGQPSTPPGTGRRKPRHQRRPAPGRARWRRRRLPQQSDAAR